MHENEYLSYEGTQELISYIKSDIAGAQSAPAGNPITLTDCAPINAESLVVELEPKQDLHGQSAPYVGGAGKNKVDAPDITGFTSNYIFSGKMLKAGTYTLSLNVDGQVTPQSQWNVAANGSTLTTAYIYSNTRNSITFTLSSDTSTLNAYCNTSASVNIKDIMVEEGQTATSFAPYSNICPITGYTECEVDDVGFNQWDEEWVNGRYGGNSGVLNPAFSTYLASKNPIPVMPNSTFYLNVKNNFSTARDVVWYDKNGDWISDATTYYEDRVYTVPSNAYYMNFNLGSTYGATYQNDISINIPSSDHDYHPYHSSNATIQFGQTVYGGRSNFTDGGTSDEFENVDLGDLSWTYRGDGLFSADLSDYAFESDVMAYCSGYRYMGTVDGASMATSNGSVYLYYNDGQSSRVIYVVNTQYTDAIVFKAAVTGIQFVYEKATTTTISTPPTELKLLKGTNNITTNGTTINLGYQPDNALGQVLGEAYKYTDKKTAGGSGNYMEKGVDYVTAGHKDGYAATVSGTGVTEEGYQVLAKGDYAHAEGYKTYASGYQSHAEGRETTSGGDCSHTEGLGTSAYYTAHAEGYKTYATVEQSHSEGYYTCVTGKGGHAEGYGYDSHNLLASNYGSHAEGYADAQCGTLSSGIGSHAEGKSTYALGDFSHSEGAYTTASTNGSHAEGLRTCSEGNCAHSEGRQTTSYGKRSHAEGYYTYAYGNNSHAEGCYTCAYGEGSHTEGYGSTSDYNFAKGDASHAEGYETTAYGHYSHVEGIQTSAKGIASHAEGSNTTAYGDYSHVEGSNTKASGDYSHAEGYHTTAYGENSHAEGYYTKASAQYSHASGVCTSAGNLASCSIGHYNAAMAGGGAPNNTNGTAFAIGNGTGPAALSNAFSVQFNGTVAAAGAQVHPAADYAEFFEWIDGNPRDTDRVGYFVTIDKNDPTKITIAEPEDDYILGIVSGAPCVIGNGDCDVWNGMTIKDDFGRTVYIEPGVPKYNPNYDPTKPYVSRMDRKEWAAVGMLGVLPVHDDGTCQVGGFCTVGQRGYATKADKYDRNGNCYKVIERVSDKVVKVIFR